MPVGRPRHFRDLKTAAQIEMELEAVSCLQIMAVIPKTQELQKVLVHFFRLNPAFLLGEALFQMSKYSLELSISEAPSSTTNAPQSWTDSASQANSALQSFAQNLTSAFNLTSAAGFNFSTTLSSGAWLSIYSLMIRDFSADSTRKH